MSISNDQDLNTESSGLPSDAWNLELPQMPVEVHGCFAASDGDRIYVVGGTSLAGHTDLIQTYDLESKSWQKASALPWQGRLMAGGLCSHGLVVAFGGAYCIYHPDTGAVDGPMSLSALSRFRNAAKGIISGERLFVLGGTWEGDERDLFSSRVVELDPADGSERVCAPMCIARSLCEAVVYGDTIYVFGGKVDNSGTRLTRCCTDTIERYDGAADRWTLLDVRMPLPRMVATLARIGNYVLLFDGQPRNDALQMSSVWVFDLQREAFVPNNWCSPYATWSGGAVLVEDTVYLAGGNQLVYRKDNPLTFAMHHTIVNRFMSFGPTLPPRLDSDLEVPRTIY